MCLQSVDMATTTIRVTRETRDLLAAQARAQGLSVTALVDRLARSNERAEMFHEERRLWRAEAHGTGVAAEDAAWEDTLADGID